MADIGKGLMFGGCGMMLTGCLLMILVPLVLIGCVIVIGAMGDADGTVPQRSNIRTDGGGDTSGVLGASADLDESRQAGP